MCVITGTGSPRAICSCVMAHSHNSASQDRDRTGSSHDLFRSLEFKESRQRSLWMSLVVHSVLLTVLLLIPMLFTDVIKLRYDMTLLAPPPPKPERILEVTHYRQPPKPKPEPKIEKPIVVPPPVKPVVTPPPVIKQPEPPKIVEVKPPTVIEPPVRNIPRPEQPAPPKPEVRTGMFNAPEPIKPNLPAAQVQTGGFGDPNGIKGEGKPGKPGNIASLGSFDLPTGAGAGNGTGGARGARTVTTAGFGDSGSTGSGSGSGAGSNRTVRQAGFGDAAEDAKSEASKKRADTGPPQTPVEILSKPKPEYTDEARKLRVEGDVLVRVLFTAQGEVRVLDVVRGLGHGLDASALRAAQQIKFKPALKDGRPVDSTATVHILFQLAY